MSGEIPLPPVLPPSLVEQFQNFGEEARAVAMQKAVVELNREKTLEKLNQAKIAHQRNIQQDKNLELQLLEIKMSMNRIYHKIAKPLRDNVTRHTRRCFGMGIVKSVMATHKPKGNIALVECMDPDQRADFTVDCRANKVLSQFLKSLAAMEDPEDNSDAEFESIPEEPTASVKVEADIDHQAGE